MGKNSEMLTYANKLSVCLYQARSSRDLNGLSMPDTTQNVWHRLIPTARLARWDNRTLSIVADNFHKSIYQRLQRRNAFLSHKREQDEL